MNFCQIGNYAYSIETCLFFFPQDQLKLRFCLREVGIQRTHSFLFPHLFFPLYVPSSFAPIFLLRFSSLFPSLLLFSHSSFVCPSFNYLLDTSYLRHRVKLHGYKDGDAHCNIEGFCSKFQDIVISIYLFITGSLLLSIMSSLHNILNIYE